MAHKETSPEHPTRIIFNFAHRCNMACKWCYIPFGSAAPDPEICRRIVARCAEIGMSVVTFGGGDPFLYPFIGDLIRVAKKSDLFVHVDTNGIGLRQNVDNARLLSTEIDLIGLPLDGPDAATHGAMRSSPQHFDLLMQRLKWLLPFRAKTKLNTIVTAVNVCTLGMISELVRTINPARWSIYQYWPLSHGIAADAEHHLDDAAFDSATAPIRARGAVGAVHVEVNPLLSRRLTYPFVGSDGALYVHAPAALQDYDVIGSIFEDAAVAELFRRCRSERAVALSRYRAGGTPNV